MVKKTGEKQVQSSSPVARQLIAQQSKKQRASSIPQQPSTLRQRGKVRVVLNKVLNFVAQLLCLVLVVFAVQRFWLNALTQLWSKYREYLWLAGVVGILVLAGYILWPQFTGFVQYDEQNRRKSKTLWDWLQLLIIPIVIAGGTLWFNTQQNDTNLQIAADQQKETVLKTYMDDMTDLSLNHGLR